MATVWMIAQVGWAAPHIYLHSSLRSVRSYRDRQEEKADAAETLESHPELVALEKELEKARAKVEKSKHLNSPTKSDKPRTD